MKIEVPFEIGDELYVIRTTEATGVKYMYVVKEKVKEVGEDERGQYVNINGTRSRLSQFNKKFFTNKRRAQLELDYIVGGYAMKGKKITTKKAENLYNSIAVSDKFCIWED